MRGLDDKEILFGEFVVVRNMSHHFSDGYFTGDMLDFPCF